VRKRRRRERGSKRERRRRGRAIVGGSDARDQKKKVNIRIAFSPGSEHDGDPSPHPRRHERPSCFRRAQNQRSNGKTRARTAGAIPQRSVERRRRPAGRESSWFSRIRLLRVPRRDRRICKRRSPEHVGDGSKSRSLRASQRRGVCAKGAAARKRALFDRKAAAIKQPPSIEGCFDGSLGGSRERTDGSFYQQRQRRSRTLRNLTILVKKKRETKGEQGPREAVAEKTERV
jgi:hypothetical protein